METILIRERYKVVRVLRRGPGYALAEAVDIRDRETPERLVNLYEGDLLHRYGKLAADLRSETCPALREKFLDGGTLALVFEDCKGETIDTVFHEGDAWDWRARLAYAERVLHHALSLADLPPEAACAALLSENLYVSTENQSVRSRFALFPMEPVEAREAALLACDQVRKILPRTLSAGEAEEAFQDRLEWGVYRSVVPLYADWRAAEPAIRAEREAFEGRNVFQRAWAMLRRGWKQELRRRGWG